MDKRARVHVAGAHTLIGAAIVRELQRQGYQQVSGLDDETIERIAPEYVFVASGKSGGIGANQRQPATLMLDNLLAATQTIAAAHRCSVKKLLYLASSCCYPKNSPQPMRVESLLTGPLEPTSEAYALAKIAGLKLCQAYRQEHGAPFISGIVADVFGSAEALDLDDLHVVPALLWRMHTAKQQGAPEVQIWGSGKPRREFVYADDAANACIFAMQHYNEADPINLGGGSEMSIRDLAESVREVVGFKGELQFDTGKPDGMPFKALDSGKLLAMGWRAQTPFKSALALTYRQMLQKIAG